MATSAQTGNALSAVFGDGVRKEIVSILDGTANGSITIPAGANLTLTSGGITITNGNLTITTGGIIRTITHQCGGGQVKAGTTAGWTVGAGNNLGTIATVAQSQTASTLVLRVQGLPVGATITGFAVYSSINAAGNTVTLDANLRKIIIAAGATGTDSSIGSITQVSVVAATASSAAKTGLTEVVVAGSNYYFLLTCSTGATTTLELTGVEITYTSS